MQVKKQPIALALAAVLLVAGCSNQQAATTPAAVKETVTPVQVETVKKGTVSASAGFTAKLAPSEEVQVSAKISGKITSLPVKLGQYVNQGTVLFSLDQQDIQNSIKQAEAALQLAQANLKQSGSSSSQGLEQAKNGLAQAETALADAQRNQQRMQQLFTEGAISSQQLEQAQLALSNAQTAHANAQQALQAAQQMNGVGVSQASVNQAAVSLQTARTQLANATVTAPISGYVSTVNGAIGQMASPSAPVLVIVKTNPLIVKANLSEQEISRVKVGTSVKVHIESLQKDLTANVTAVSPVMDAQLKAYPIEISIPNPSNELKADMVVNVVFDNQTDAKKSALVVPRKAVFDRDGKKFVYLIEGDIAKQVEVTTGEESSDMIEITSGVTEGAKVVVKGQTLLKENSKVSIQQ
ncbi:efflux RND transporter periplasmic adaptor subunit [Brevibacillus dissolubilis]|uniref:efflux RND transporter periplasmic adaptor subunit n=1 Tax=Brevibacillus dissolubilis TaxID=1844116 RepID=UPI0011162AA6|nr:efflux RND transporter periplasmic adaptor subunit [Brevibacillus dissolubilis]